MEFRRSWRATASSPAPNRSRLAGSGMSAVDGSAAGAAAADAGVSKLLARSARLPDPTTVTIASAQEIQARFAVVICSSRRTPRTIAKSVPGLGWSGKCRQVTEKPPLSSRNQFGPVRKGRRRHAFLVCLSRVMETCAESIPTQKRPDTRAL